jgi:GntR family transcriptional repressor for pyruvate dehydrogenase complex
MRDRRRGPLAPAEDRELILLAAIGDSAAPVGCGTLAKVLQHSGWTVGEATVGRMLRDLETGHLLTKVGRQGRLMAEPGRQRLRELTLRRRQLESGQVIHDMLSRASQDELLEVLVARRAVEGETASLAAQRADAAQLQAIAEAVAISRDHADHAAYSSEDDVRFHTRVAAASGNPVLAATLEVIRQAEWLFPAFLHIRRHTSGRIVVDHAAIYEAMRARDAWSARAMMVAHIEQVMADVRACWAGGAEAGSDAIERRAPQLTRGD